MSIVFVVKREARESIGHSYSPRFDVARLVDDPEKYPMLAYLDPWGKAIFNRAQTREVRKELEQLAATADPELAQELNELMKLCDVVTGPQYHLYLVARGE